MASLEALYEIIFTKSGGVYIYIFSPPLQFCHAIKDMDAYQIICKLFNGFCISMG